MVLFKSCPVNKYLQHICIQKYIQNCWVLYMNIIWILQASLCQISYLHLKETLKQKLHIAVHKLQQKKCRKTPSTLRPFALIINMRTTTILYSPLPTWTVLLLHLKVIMFPLTFHPLYMCLIKIELYSALGWRRRGNKMTWSMTSLDCIALT